jgi:hypothetical protein
MKLVNASDNLYLSPPQQKELLDYAKSLGRRFDAAKAVEANEVKLLDSTVVLLQDNHPEIGDVKDAGWDSHGADLSFALRSIVQGMLVDDDDHAGLVAVTSLARHLKHLDFSGDAVKGVFESLTAACEDTLPPDAFETLKPYLAEATAVAA